MKSCASMIDFFDMIAALNTIIPKERIRDRYIDLVSFAADAGFYYLLPKAVVLPVSEEEIIQLFQFSSEKNIPIVFRAGGTSLSGQCITDGILVDLSQYWKKCTIENQSQLVRVQPGITGAMVNAYLKKYQRKIGPDPASINAAMMGGILSNNASGMCCGVAQNSYHTTQYIRFVLPDGKRFSTELKDDYTRFEQDCSEIAQTLLDIKAQIHSNTALFDKIRKKYQTKTTVGYSLNAFVDFEHPLDILAHLLIGAEGTLAFIAEAVMQTVPDYPHKATALFYFPDIYEACKAILPLKDAGAMTVELMDRASLRSVEAMEGIPPIIKTLPDTAAALLVEFQESSNQVLEERVSNCLQVASAFQLVQTPEFTTDTAIQQFYWKIRKGMFPAVGAVRAKGTTVVLEDVAFPVESLGAAIHDLHHLFKTYEYHNAIIFGHAKDGNIHFVVTQSFNTPEEIDRYDRFIQDVVSLVVNKHNGTLKAEHGTGRNMAPFVETEWGEEAYEIMKRLKQVIDPRNLLNPGVIINESKDAHIQHLKKLPVVEEEVDRCIECGFCEHVCPSRDLTATPRRRIVIRRVLENLRQEGKTREYETLLQQYQYDGTDTCAVDGMCATACPVDINTGDLVKRLRRENHSAAANKWALRVAKHFGKVESVVRIGLKLGSGVNAVFGKKAMVSLTKGMKKMVPAMPLWSEQLQAPPSKLRTGTVVKHLERRGSIVYFPACISRVMGKYSGKDKNLMETFLSICKKVGIDVVIPENIHGSCCGQIFSSKGFGAAYQYTANKTVSQLWEVSKEGVLPIVMDVSSCTYTLKHLRSVLNAEDQEKFDKLTILDSVEFLNNSVLPITGPKPLNRSVVLHPVCSLKKMKTDGMFLNIAQHYATQVTVPLTAGCCGMAGDRGFLIPELTEAATMAESMEVKQRKYDGYYSSTKTCEIAMSEAVQQNYESILFLVDEAI